MSDEKKLRGRWLGRTMSSEMEWGKAFARLDKGKSSYLNESKRLKIDAATVCGITR